MSPKPEPQEIPDDAELTQFGEMGENGPEFRNRTRPERGEPDMSLIWGKITAAAASVIVRRLVVPGAIVRYATAEAFRSKGFTVVHTPSKKNSQHVSVLPPTQSDNPVEWDEGLAKLFDSCFTE